MSLFSILIILIIVALLFGGYGSTRDGWGYAGWSPLGLILVIFIVLAFTGALR
jgi:Sec-independent protein translocase protein TatA